MFSGRCVKGNMIMKYHRNNDRGDTADQKYTNL